MKSIHGKVVVITGASAGAGRSIARLFGSKGARIALLARGTEGLEGAKQEVEAIGGKAIVIPTDVSDPAQVERAAEAAEEQLGPISIWINNAMVGVFSPAADMTAEEFRRVTEVTYLGQVHGTLAALKRMRKHGRGTIILVGSGLAYQGAPLQSAYSAAEHAVRGFAESLRAELRQSGSPITVSMVQLPALNTPQFRLAKNRLRQKIEPSSAIFQPEVAAEAVYYAALHPRGELLVGWPTLKTVLVKRLLPWLTELYPHIEARARREAEEPGRPDNLWIPVPGDHGAHGIFDRRAYSSSPQLWLTTHRPLTAMLGIAAITVIAAAIKFRSKELRAAAPKFTNGEAARTGAAFSNAEEDRIFKE